MDVDRLTEIFDAAETTEEQRAEMTRVMWTQTVEFMHRIIPAFDAMADAINEAQP